MKQEQLEIITVQLEVKKQFEIKTRTMHFDTRITEFATKKDKFDASHTVFDTKTLEFETKTEIRIVKLDQSQFCTKQEHAV